MADKAPPAPAPAAPAEAKDAAAPAKKGRMKMIITAAIVVLLEVGTVFITMSLSSGPKPATAHAPEKHKEEEVEKDAEVKLVEAKLPNTQQGRLYLYDLQVVAKVAEKNKEKVTKLFEERESEIKDQIRTIIASSDPKALGEPGLETVRRQINFQLEHILGKELIKEVLIPKCTPFRAEM